MGTVAFTGWAVGELPEFRMGPESQENSDVAETSSGAVAKASNYAVGNRIRLGISACLLGEKTRYDGGHTRDSFLVDTLGRHIDWVPVCPEVECGLPVPREAIELVGSPESPRLMSIGTSKDITKRMLTWARRRVVALKREILCGYVFKSKSPSCGMARVKVRDAAGKARKVGVGIFAREFIGHFPLLPVEDENRLHNPVQRENFIERVVCLKRYRDRVAAIRTRAALAAFHADHKLLLMSHSPALMREMDRLVAEAKRHRPKELMRRYEAALLAALRLKATPRKHINCLHHMLHCLKKFLAPDEKQEMLDQVEQYAQGRTPLVVPMTLMQHAAGKYDATYLTRQVYLNPHPLELKLRNHA
jgi:uncharacterized protein YbbK (DUF523 family)/uncharacterized protein YbgA (DUF1722 family)